MDLRFDEEDYYSSEYRQFVERLLCREGYSPNQSNPQIKHDCMDYTEDNLRAWIIKEQAKKDTSCIPGGDSLQHKTSGNFLASDFKLASRSPQVTAYLSGSDYQLGDPVYFKSKEQTQQENKMDLNVLVKLVDTTYNDDLKTSGKYFDALPEKVVEALKRKIEDEKNCVAEDAAEEILKLIKGYDQEIDRLVGMLREYRKKVDQCKARLKALNEAMEYGNSTSNYLPLAKTMGFNVNGIDPKLLDFTPLDRTTESSTLKE